MRLNRSGRSVVGVTQSSHQAHIQASNVLKIIERFCSVAGGRNLASSCFCGQMRCDCERGRRRTMIHDVRT